IFDEVIPSITNDSLKLSKRISGIRTFRNYKFSDAVPRLIELLLDEKQPDSIRTNLAETLGWFNFSIKRGDIIAAIDKILNDKLTSAFLKNEALKTKSRLTTGANDVMIP
ncbi:MAG: hypothetical protein K8H86_02870, partial [Ignavibacteriaceae bacterium]|nr:hypothetical protein [Ignavibacteriaceae bacterium]